MASLADTFLKDLEDLDLEEEEEEIVVEQEEKEETKNIQEQNPAKRLKLNDGKNEIKKDNNEKNIENGNALKHVTGNIKKNQCTVSELLYNKEILKTLEEIQQYVKDQEEGNESKEEKKEQGECEDKMVEQCIELVLKIDTEILNIHKFVKEIYSTKFPELESIVYNPIEYLSVVDRIRNESDLTNIDFSDILPNTTIMAITVASSMTTGIKLQEHLLQQCVSVCSEGIELSGYRKSILLYLESKMFLLAPNLTVLLGSALTAQLISSVGSLKNLVTTSSQNLIVIGNSKKTNTGMSNVHKMYGVGILAYSEIVQSMNENYRGKAIKLLASKCSLAARIDYFKKYPEGQYGLMLRDQIIQHLVKLQEPPPLKQKKVLPIPDEKVKRKRGGRRYRKLKEKTEITELRKQINRLPFGPEAADDSYIFTNENTNLLNSNITKLKIQTKQKANLPKKKNMNVHSSGATNGLSSSLIFTPLQGIELCNPSLIHQKKQEEQGDKSGYFSKTTQFRKV